MKDTISKISDLSRISVQNLKKLINITRLVSLIDAINNTEEDKDTFVELPGFGKLRVTKDMDFYFIPDIDLKKDIYSIKNDPEFFLKKELKRLLDIDEKELSN